MLGIQFHPKAVKEIKKIRKQDKKFYERLNNAIEVIRQDPKIGNSKKYDLAGYYSLDLYNQGTNYELVYRIEYDENDNVIVIIMFGTRENFYQELKRRLGL
ncbi:type II toxin-antitoxin system mRNA interferase toxin, RelE/StbE family [Bacillaceae bacterium Marseille-Q3522]|nr:type II toxin-antitoxin system mRNA interferase toxin, RelE/StbE family [Bacillaceae bacterium Marseille-Q3522]